MIKLKEYLVESLIYLTEAKLEDFVNKYMKVHANHEVVKSSPELARQLIGAAHKHANDHDEAMFLTDHLLSGFYKPEEDDMTMSGVIGTWRSAKAKNLIPKEAKLAGVSHDDLMERFKSIPELADIKVGLGGKQRKALSALDQHKLGTIDHPEYGKLTVYNFDKNNAGEEARREELRKHFSNLCTGTRYHWCVLGNKSYMETYVKKGTGFFTYVDENGVAKISHGYGDRGTTDVPAGVVVNPDNSTHRHQELVKRQTLELLPKEKKLEYALTNNLFSEKEIDEKMPEILRMYSEKEPGEHAIGLTSLPPSVHRKFSDDTVDTIYKKATKHLEGGRDTWDLLQSIGGARFLTTRLADRILAKPEISKQDTSILKNLNLGLEPSRHSEPAFPEEQRPLQSYERDLLNLQQTMASHPNPSVRRALAANDQTMDRQSYKHMLLDDDVFKQLLNDSDPSVRHNALIGKNMTTPRKRKFIFDKSQPVDDRVKAFFSAGTGYATHHSFHDIPNEMFLDPDHEEFMSKIIKQDTLYRSSYDRKISPNDINRFVNLYSTNKPNSPVVTSLIQHPEFSKEHFDTLMAQTNNPDIFESALKSKYATPELVQKVLNHPEMGSNPHLRSTALLSRGTDLEGFHKALKTETNPDVRNHLLSHLDESHISRYFVPGGRVFMYLPPEQRVLTDYHRKNRDYALNSGEEFLIRHVYNTTREQDQYMFGGTQDNPIPNPEKVSPDLLLKHLNTKWKNPDTTKAVVDYARTNYASYKDHPELSYRIKTLDSTGLNSNMEIQPVVDLRIHEQVNPRKYLKKTALNSIQNYFKQL